MRIVVCLRFGLDVAELRPDPTTGGPRLDRPPWRIDPFSRNALEAAAQLREANGGEVVVLSVVPGEPPRRLVLEALASGADAAHLVVDPTAEQADALGLCGVLAAALAELQPWSLLLCGDAAADRYERQVGPRLAEALGLPAVTRAVALEVAGDRLVAERSLDDRVEVVDAPLPAVVTVTQESNEVRIAPLLQVMAASARPVRVTAASELAGAPSAGAATGSARLGLRAPPSRRKRIRVQAATDRDAADLLARHLAAEGVLRP